MGAGCSHDGKGWSITFRKASVVGMRGKQAWAHKPDRYSAKPTGSKPIIGQPPRQAISKQNNPKSPTSDSSSSVDKAGQEKSSAHHQQDGAALPKTSSPSTKQDGNVEEEVVSRSMENDLQRQRGSCLSGDSGRREASADATDVTSTSTTHLGKQESGRWKEVAAREDASSPALPSLMERGGGLRNNSSRDLLQSGSEEDSAGTAAFPWKNRRGECNYCTCETIGPWSTLEQQLSNPEIMRLSRALSLNKEQSGRSLNTMNVYPGTLGPARPLSSEDRVGAPVPSNESFRLRALRSYSILDTEPTPKFDRLTALACEIFKAPVALVSLVDKDRQWFKSKRGLNCRETDRESSFCAYLLLPSPNPCLLVRDALQDKRFYRNKLVTGEPHIRSYAGAPLISSTGFVLGSFCIIDFVPRDFSEHDMDVLQSLALLASAEIEKHVQSLSLQRIQKERFEEDRRGLLQAIDAFSEGLVLFDVSQPGQPIVFVNEAFEVITGYKMQEIVGRHSGELLQGPATCSVSCQRLQDAVQAGRSESVEILNYRKDGSTFWNWMRIRPISDDSFAGLWQGPEGRSSSRESPSADSPVPGEMQPPPQAPRQYYFGIVSDCTERKQQEAELQAIRMREMEARASSLAKREFVANISHEIRTPMNVIIACSQLLSDTPNLSSEQQELLQMITGSGQQLLSLINDILDFSKLEARKMDLQVREFNAWSCLDFCIEMLRLKCDTKELDLSFSVDPVVPTWIWSDEVRLRQVITNLLSNAAKFTDAGGEIEIHVTARQVPQQQHDGLSSPPAPVEGPHFLPVFELMVSVRDTGIGMPLEFQKVIFEAFTQCDNSRTRKYEGTGLGMAISKDLVERMGGSIWVQSAPGQGSIFFFTIQTRGSFIHIGNATDDISREEALTRPRTFLADAHALLVGTSGTFQRMAASILQSWGVHVTAVRTRQELVHAWRTHLEAKEERRQEQGAGESTRPGHMAESPSFSSFSDRLPQEKSSTIHPASTSTSNPPWPSRSSPQSKQSGNGLNTNSPDESQPSKRRHPSTIDFIIIDPSNFAAEAATSSARTSTSANHTAHSEEDVHVYDPRLARFVADDDVTTASTSLPPRSATTPFAYPSREQPTSAGAITFERLASLSLPSSSPPPPASLSSSSSFPSSAKRAWSDSAIPPADGCGCEMVELCIWSVIPNAVVDVPIILLLGKSSRDALDVTNLRKDVHVLTRPIRVQQMYDVVSSIMSKNSPHSSFSTSTREPCNIRGKGQQHHRHHHHTPAQQQSSSSCAQQSLRILIADDNPVNQKVLLKLLKAFGHSNCSTASSGVQVLERMKEGEYDVILMDLQMPHMDGITATCKLRAGDGGVACVRQPLIVALTADVGAGIEEECRESGMNSYLSKPIKRESLQRLLDLISQIMSDGQWDGGNWDWRTCWEPLLND